MEDTHSGLLLPKTLINAMEWRRQQPLSSVPRPENFHTAPGVRQARCETAPPGGQRKSVSVEASTSGPQPPAVLAVRVHPGLPKADTKAGWAGRKNGAAGERGLESRATRSRSEPEREKGGRPGQQLHVPRGAQRVRQGGRAPDPVTSRGNPRLQSPRSPACSVAGREPGGLTKMGLRTAAGDAPCIGDLRGARGAPGHVTWGKGLTLNSLFPPP